MQLGAVAAPGGDALRAVPHEPRHLKFVKGPPPQRGEAMAQYSSNKRPHLL